MNPQDPHTFDPATMQPSDPSAPPLPPTPEASPEPDYGNEAAVAFARAKLEALLRQQHPGWNAPADQVVQPPPATPTPPMYQPAASPVIIPAEEPASSQAPEQFSAAVAPPSIYPIPTQPLTPVRPTAEVTPLPETIPQAQYEVETALQNEVQPQFHHVSPSHQLAAEAPTPMLSAAEPAPQLLSPHIPGQPPGLAQQPVIPQPSVNPLGSVMPPADIHQVQPIPRRADQVKAYAENARSAVRGVHHGFLKPLFKTTIVTLIIFLIYNAPLVMGQVYYYITPASSDPTPVILDPSATSVTADPRIIISKLNIDVPAVYDEESYNERKIQEALERGIVHYGTTALPGEKGNAVFLGHSSNSPWAPGKFKTAFSLLRKLQVNDTFVVHYEKKRYIYQVYERKVIDPADFSVIDQDVKDPIATLITCDPPGANWNRLVIHARQISPNPADNTPHRGATAVPDSRSIPGSPPSLWERVTSIF
jgi:LPXTG-site transpeptidase (sortase) family protein